MVRGMARQFSVSSAARSLSAWTTDVLRQAITDGYLESGQRLDQDAIAEELQVSRTPLREAIAALESEGLLQSKPHRGVFVSEVTTKDIHEVYGLRALLEAEIARQAADSVPDAVLGELEASLQDAQKAYDDGDPLAQFQADRQFHETLRVFAKNDLLREVLEGVSNRISAVRRFAQMRPGPHVDEFAREHFDILEAVRQGDGDRAAALTKLHLENSARRLEELMASEAFGGEGDTS